MINVNDFKKTYISILLTFVSSKIINQTNVLMLSALGENYVSAYIIPTKFMIIDTIFIFALAPIVSIAISGGKDLKKIMK